MSEGASSIGTRAAARPQAAGSASGTGAATGASGTTGEGGALGGDAGASGDAGALGAATCEPIGDSDPAKLTRFAVIGDYGGGPGSQRVAELVKSWHVDFILTAGDNNYPTGERETIDQNIGRYFAEFICPYRGSYGHGSSKNRFFPALGNHDWYSAGAKPYLDYFSLPGNERYYDFVWGSVHAFMLDSDPSEPDGVTADSAQARWLAARLSASVSRWKIVVMHHPPYSSGLHGSSEYMRWPFKQWGADLVFAGHDHDYERVDVDGVPHIVAGLGGASTYGFNTTISGSRSQFNSSFGAALLEADSRRLLFRFFDVERQQQDSLILGEP